jgi:hypothetical protein
MLESIELYVEYQNTGSFDRLGSRSEEVLCEKAFDEFLCQDSNHTTKSSFRHCVAINVMEQRIEHCEFRLMIIIQSFSNVHGYICEVKVSCHKTLEGYVYLREQVCRDIEYIAPCDSIASVIARRSTVHPFIERRTLTRDK